MTPTEYFSQKNDLKNREEVLAETLKASLSRSSDGAKLFEYLVIHIELEKVRLCKELSPITQGRIQQLSDLLLLFS